ncbi:MAG: hypothetical protein ABJD11_05045 [Gemmatimonadota bacterium]
MRAELMSFRTTLFALAFCATISSACSGNAAPRGSAPSRSEEGALADSLADIVSAALRADARGETADSLYAQGALIVANGEHRTETPRYAGFERGGEVDIASSRIDVNGVFAWGYVEYRWLRTSDNRAEEGRATLILAPAPGSGRWRIVHAHSSTQRPAG